MNARLKPYNSAQVYLRCPLCGFAVTSRPSRPKLIEMTVHLSKPRPGIVRAHIELEPRIVIYPFEITEVVRFRGPPGFRWRAGKMTCQLFPPAPLHDFSMAEEQLRLWAGRTMEVETAS